MKVSIITTTYINNFKNVVTENVKNDDLRLEMLKDFKNLHNTWRILDYIFDYECSQTKHGYKVTKTIRQNTETKETIITEFKYN